MDHRRRGGCSGLRAASSRPNRSISACSPAATSSVRPELHRWRNRRQEAARWWDSQRPGSSSPTSSHVGCPRSTSALEHCARTGRRSLADRVAWTPATPPGTWCVSRVSALPLRSLCPRRNESHPAGLDESLALTLHLSRCMQELTTIETEVLGEVSGGTDWGTAHTILTQALNCAGG